MNNSVTTLGLGKIEVDILFKIGAKQIVRDNRAEREAYLFRKARREMRMQRRIHSRFTRCPPSCVYTYKEIDFKSLGIRKRQSMKKERRKYKARKESKGEKIRKHSDRHDQVDMDVKSKIRCHRRIHATNKRSLETDRMYYVRQPLIVYQGVVTMSVEENEG